MTDPGLGLVARRAARTVAEAMARPLGLRHLGARVRDLLRPAASRTRAAIDPPPVRLFRDLPVLPMVARYPSGKGGPDKALDGGPLWPDFDDQGWARFISRGRPADRRPAAPDRAPAPFDRPCTWIGYLEARHFGHLVSEHLGRLLWSRRLRPDDACLVLAEAGMAAEGLPPFVRDVLDWCGLPLDDLVIVREPLLARELRVVPQAETLHGPAPSEAYLDLLDDHTRRMGLDPIPSEMLFVGRPGLAAAGKGAHAGEGYLAALLRRKGATILDPGAVPLRVQLAHYLGARTLVFAEGSAMHGRQLLGRADQRIVVLNRRQGSRLARPALAPRCRELSYVEATRHAVVPIRPSGRRLEALALASYDSGPLLRGLARAGIDLAAEWREDEWAEAARIDGEDWCATISGTPERFDVAASLAAYHAAPVPGAPASGRP